MTQHHGGNNRASDASVAVIRRALEAWSSGDMEAAAAILADDIEWHEIGRAEPIRGKAALAQRFSQPGAVSYEITGETHDILANEDHAVALVTATATRNGRSLTYRVAEIYHVRDGQITGRWAFSDDTAAINEFFGGS